MHYTSILLLSLFYYNVVVRTVVIYIYIVCCWQFHFLVVHNFYYTKMGASSSVIQNMSHERIIEFAEENKLPQSIVDAIASSNTIDGEALAQAFFAFSKVPQIKDESKSITVKQNLGFELDMHGQRLTWYLRWAIENCIPGYQQFMLKRSWCWRKTWKELAKEGWSFDQVQKGILGCHFHGGFSSSIDCDSVKNWLITSKEIPGSSSPLEKSETTGSVAYRIIKPATEPSKLTYRQAFIGEEDSKKSTHFVSHSWSYPFWSVLEALINHQLGYDRSWVFTSSMTDILEILDKLPVNKVNYYWFDLFNKNQHIVTSDSTSVELAEGIRQPGKMVFVLHPSMQWSVKRIWCLYEVASRLFVLKISYLIINNQFFIIIYSRCWFVCK